MLFRSKAATQQTWKNQRLKNNTQLGVFEIDPHRISDVPGEHSHILILRGQRFTYFDFCASNRALYRRDVERLAELQNLAGTTGFLQPNPHFSNPLSVGLSLFCEDGNWLVLTRRTTLPSGGAWLTANRFFNSVGEMINPVDVKVGQHAGYAVVSPYNTARRGLS